MDNERINETSESGSENKPVKRREKLRTAKKTSASGGVVRASKKGLVAPNRLELLITVVNRKKYEYFVDLIQSFDVNMQLTVLAHGTAATAAKAALEYLGLSDNDRIVIFSFVREDRMNDIMDTLEEKFKTIKDGNGVAAAVPFTSIIGKLVYGFLCNDERTIQEG